MNSRSLTVLAVLTAIVVAAAIASHTLRSGGRAPGLDTADRRLFPGLEERINEVESVSVESGGEALEIRRRDGRWTVESLDGYPAKFEEVKSLVLSVAALEIAERKTADPSRHARLGLEPPGGGRSSRLVSLIDGAGTSLAGLIIGSEAGSGGTNLVYARRADEDQTWLVRGKVDAITDPMRWVDTSVVSIPRARVKRVSIAHPDGETVTIARPDATTADFAVQDLPEGMTHGTATQVNAIADGLSFLRMEGVRAAGVDPTDPASPVVATFETFDGLVVEVRTWDDSGTVRATLAARANDAERVEASEGETGAVEEAEALTARLQGWVFDLPRFAGDRLRRRLADVTQRQEPQEPTPADTDDEPAAPWERPVGED